MLIAGVLGLTKRKIISPTTKMLKKRDKIIAAKVNKINLFLLMGGWGIV
jgi:hypothetical protein